MSSRDRSVGWNHRSRSRASFMCAFETDQSRGAWNIFESKFRISFVLGLYVFSTAVDLCSTFNSLQWSLRAFAHERTAIQGAAMLT